MDELYQADQPGAIKIRAFFEGTYLRSNGSVNRAKLLRTLFKHPKKWEVLNRMIHPLVAETLKQRLAKIERGVVVLEIPIYDARLFGKIINELWVITCSEAIQAKRLTERKLTPKQIEIFNKQHRGDAHPHTILIENNGSVKDLERTALKRYNNINE